MHKEKQQLNAPLKLADLPKKMQQKSKNSIVFSRQPKSLLKKFEFDPEKIKKRKI